MTSSSRQQTLAINTYVNAINAAGGINGRKIIPDIVTFDPTNETNMRSLCKQWTEGSPPVFAVLDGIGTWTGDNQLCITQEGHTPLIGAVDDRRPVTPRKALRICGGRVRTRRRSSRRSSPGVRQAGLLGSSKKVADRRRRPVERPARLERLPVARLRKGRPAETDGRSRCPRSRRNRRRRRATHRSSCEKPASLTVSSRSSPSSRKTRSSRYLSAEIDAELLPEVCCLSDYEDTIDIALGLIPVPFDRLELQEGITVETLGGADENSITQNGTSTPLPESQGGYDPGVQSLLQHLEGAQRSSEVQVAVHRGAGTDRRLVPGDNPLRRRGRRRPGPT